MMAVKKPAAADKAELEAQLEYARNCLANTSVAEARAHWAAVIRSCERGLGVDGQPAATVD